MSFTAQKTYGEYAHSLTISEMPSHSHNANGGNFIVNDTTRIDGGKGTDFWRPQSLQKATAETGGSNSHNNVQPSICVYFWRRTA